MTEKTFDVFDKAIDYGITQKIPEATKEALRKNAFVFSGMKVYTSLREVGSLHFSDEKGNPKSWNEFKKEADKLNEQYNEHYLRTEYDFANYSAQQVDKWQDIENDGDRYNLKYRTAGDDKVRDSHAEMEGIVRPVDDDFWDDYFPPNGWNCRCEAIQVSKSKNHSTNKEKAIEKGRKGTTQIGKNGKNNAAIFRFNPGKNKKIFPDNHPYTSGNCGNLAAVWQNLSAQQKIQLVNEADKCRAKKEVDKEATRKLRKEKSNEIKEWYKEHIPEGGITQNNKNLKTGKAVISRSAIREVANHFRSPYEMEMAKDIKAITQKATFKNAKPLDPSSHNYEKKIKRGVTGYNYYHFTWQKEQWRLNMEVIDEKYEKPYAINKIKKG